MPNPETIFSALIWRDYTTSIHQSCNERLFLSLCAITQTNVLHVVHTSFSTHFLIACCEWKTRAPLSIPNLMGWGGKTLLIPPHRVAWRQETQLKSRAHSSIPELSPQTDTHCETFRFMFLRCKKRENLRMFQHVKRFYKAWRQI